MLRPLIWLLVILLVAGGSAGGTWWLLSTKFQAQIEHADASAPAHAAVNQGSAQGSTPINFIPTSGSSNSKAMQVPDPIFIPLEAFTLTLQDAESERVLHVAVTLRTNDEQTRERIEKYLPEVRSRILMMLSGLSPSAVQTQQGKVDIANSILKLVNLPFSPLPDGQYVTDVLFTAFVVQ